MSSSQPETRPPVRRVSEASMQQRPSQSADVAAANADKLSAPAARRRPGRWILALALLALVALIICGYRFLHRSQDDAEIRLEGNIDVRQVNLAFKVDGRIVSLEVDEGDSVSTGQIVGSLDKRYFEDDLRLVSARRDNAASTLARLENGSRPEEIAEARAQVAERQATLDRARHDFERAERLVDKGAVSRESFDQMASARGEAEARLKYTQEVLRLAEIGPRKEDIDAARAQLAAEEASVVQSKRRLADSELIAPSAGIILTRSREKGAIVAAGETVFTLTLDTPVWVRTYVNEQDLGRIQPGMQADVRTDSAPDKIYHGQIGFISPTAEFTPKSVETRELRTDLVYRLRVLVDNPDGGLRQGMPVSVTLNLNRSTAQPKRLVRPNADTSRSTCRRSAPELWCFYLDPRN